VDKQSSNMNIIVCAKSVPDSGTIRYDIRTNSLVNIQHILNPIDEISTSEAIKIRDKYGGSITAITLGPSHAAEQLRSCLKMGVDNAIHICDPSFDNVDVQTTAYILAKQIEKLPYDIILCGNESMDEGNGFAGIGIAEILDLPLVTSVTRIDIFPDTHSATVHRRLRGGDREIIETPCPAVLTIDSVLGKPIYPRLRTILAGLKKDIATVDAKSLGIDLNNIDKVSEIGEITQQKPRLKKTASIDTSLSASERMKLIISGGVSDKSTKVIVKPAPESASEIVQFLINNGIVSSNT